MSASIVLIGAGSASFGRGQIVDILAAEDLQGRGISLVLVDIDRIALERMTALAERIASYFDSDISIHATTDRREALERASFAITAVARERMRLWEQDYRIPNAYGCDQILGENGGPGAVFHALRSFHQIMPICRDMEELCPDALFLNFTNPEARVLHAVSHLTSLRAVGICHGVANGIDFIARMLNRDSNEFEVTSAGVNHFYAFLQVIDRTTGADILDEVKRAALEYEGSPPLFRRMLEIFDVFSFPSDDHMGEYLAFGNEYHGRKWHYGVESSTLDETGRDSTATNGLTIEDIDKYARGEFAIDDRICAPSGECTVPLIASIVCDRPRRFEAVNVLNTDSYITNIPASGAVEVPATADKHGVHPEYVGSIPEPFAEFIRRQYAIHEVLTEAYRTGSRKLLLQALLLDPLIHSIKSAEKILDDMLRQQKDYVPEFAATSTS
jgi:alpha-galactosidase